MTYDMVRAAILAANAADRAGEPAGRPTLRKVVNRTHYRTDDLRRVLLGAIREEGEDGRAYTVTVGYTRRGGCSGYAYYGASSFVVRVPRTRLVVKEGGEGGRARAVREPLTALDHSDVVDLARVAMHELQHCAGKRHGEMCDSFKRAGEARGGATPAPWCEGLVVRAVTKPAKPTMDERVAKRAEHAAAMLAAWQRKSESAERMVAKWTRKVAYYAKRDERVTAERAAAMEPTREKRPVPAGLARWQAARRAATGGAS